MNLAISEDAKHRNEKLVISGNCHCPPSFRYSRLSMIRQTSRKYASAWEQRKLGEIVSIGAGAPPSAFSAGNFLYVKVDDLNESSHFQFDSAQRVDANTAVKPIRKGSIIFAKRGAAILGNKVRVLGKTAYIDTNMMALEPRGVDADFLWLFINQTGLYRIADTSTIPQINNKHIEPYPVDIPNMAEQQAIGTFFSRLDDLITLHQRKRLWFAK
ncbi:restriction endonuclease subunit S [Bifidobacterium longum]|uniref:restriction endonuclease subunit S n=2 Tax=Bifidobacterium longum TaxID=216816 RepID=UPI0027BA3298|nr:restriction endonuclease subunit S [Bifidobacterium longum]